MLLNFFSANFFFFLRDSLDPDEKPARLHLAFSSFFFLMHAFQWIGGKCTVHTLFTHCSRDPQPLYSEKKILKMDPTALFTHLKIIFLQYFQFLVFSKINCIQTDHERRSFLQTKITILLYPKLATLGRASLIVTNLTSL